MSAFRDKQGTNDVLKLQAARNRAKRAIRNAEAPGVFLAVRGRHAKQRHRSFMRKVREGNMVRFFGGALQKAVETALRKPSEQRE